MLARSLTSNAYLESDYVELQYSVYNGILKAENPNATVMSIRINPFPVPKGMYRRADPANVNVVVLLLFMMYSIPVVMGTVVGIVTERKLQLLEVTI